MSLSVMTSIKLYFIFIRDSLDFDNLIIKFNAMLSYSYFNVVNDLSNLYNLCLLLFNLLHTLHF